MFISSYIPDQYTPVVTIPVSIHVWRKDDGTGNWWQDTPAFRDSLQVAFDYLNFIYAHNVPYSLYIPNTQFVEDTKVRFLIDTVYYHNDSHLAFENNIDSFQYYLADNHPECLKYFNYHLSIDSTANFSGHSSGYNSDYPSIVSVHQNKSKHLYSFALHMAHEFGHNFGLDHTYEHDPLEVNHTGGTEFLWDVFGREQQPWCQHTPPERVCLHDAGWDCDPFDSTNTCTNNIMGGTAYSRHFSALQCGRIQRALQVSSLRHFAYGEENPPDLHITRNQLVDYSRRYYQNVIVDSGVTLTISCQVEMPPNARLIVRPGGKLIVDGGTITSACDGEMWQGIEVVGDRTKNQTAANQGVVELRNGATIENALCGIYTGLRGDTDFATTGGIVSASDAVFRNNARAVEINSYAGTAPAGTVADNLCAFESCTFTIDSANLFAANNTSFAEHVRLWDVKAVKFKGCTFENRTHGATAGGQGIYADDAGVKIDVKCADDNVLLPGYCGCPPALSDSCLFTGFATAVEVVTSGTPYAVTIDRAIFTDNATGVRINGNPFATVIRCDFALSSGLQTARYLYGLRLDGCSGFKVEANRFDGAAQFLGGSTVGIYVGGSGSAANTLYRNQFDNLTYGVYAAGGNSGLQIQCNEFDSCGTNIYVSTRSSISSSQGSTRTSAGNKFQQTFGFDIRNGGSQDIYYYYKNTASNGYANPSLTSGIVYVGESSTANSCPSTLCSTLPGPTPFLLAGFTSQVNAYATAHHSAAPSGATEPQTNTHSAGTTQPQPNAQVLTDLRQSLSATYRTAVRALMADSLLDLAALEQWHTAAQSLADPYSLTETRFVEGYAEAFAADADDAELANYAEFHAMKVALRGDNNDNVDNQDNSGTPFVNWYALTPAQIAQLQAIAERNTGRASVMAKGVLCFFHGICYEDNLLVNDNMDNWDNTGDGEMAGKRAKCVAADMFDNAALTVYPNPADDLLHIELAGDAGIASAALFDLQGRAVRTRFIASANSQTATVDMRNVPAGVYILRVNDDMNRQFHHKIIIK